MVFQATRRRFIVGSLFLPLTSEVGRTKSNSYEPHFKSESRAILQRRLDVLLEKRRQLDEQWRFAYGQLPDWCKPGRQLRDQNGEPTGPIVGWPPSFEPIAITDRTFLIRPSPRNLHELLLMEAESGGRFEAITKYQHRIRDLRRRLKQRRQIAGEVGLPRSSDWAPIDQEIEAIEALIAT